MVETSSPICLGTQEVPKPFSDLTPEQFARLNGLLDEYFDFCKRGCLLVVVDTATGRIRKMNEKLDEMSRLAKLSGREATMQLLQGVSLITLGARSPNDIQVKLKEAFLQGTHGGQPTGNLGADQHIIRIMRFASLAGSKLWQRKASSRS